jgi:ech hydrogenase subunit C
MGFLSKSPWIIHYDGTSCNGCDIEVLAALMPRYDLERFGVVNTGNPKHADILLLTGSINTQSREVVQSIYDQMPSPKVVVAVGICATSGGIFRECYNVLGGADKAVPVDLYVPGCPVRPEALIDAAVQAVGILEKKRAAALAEDKSAVEN